MVEGEEVALIEAKTRIESGIPVVVVVAQMEVILLARGVSRNGFATPVESVSRCVDVCGEVAIIVGCEREIEAVVQEIAFSILKRRHEGMPKTILLAVDDLLSYTGL